MRILLADDYENFRKVLATVLRHDGHDVEEVGDGHALLTSVARRAPDLLLADVKLPMISAMIALEQLRDRGLAVRTILMTGDDADDLDGEADRLGALCLLRKPFTLEELRAVMAELAPA